MEANPPSGVNDSRDSPETNSGLAPLLSEGSRGRVWSRRKWEQPARRGHLGSDSPIVKGWVTVTPAFIFPGDCVLEATFLPECAATLLFVNGEVTIRG